MLYFLSLILELFHIIIPNRSFQLADLAANILGVSVERPVVIESTAMGAAYLAGIQTGVWNKENIANKRQTDRLFNCDLDNNDAERLYNGWKEAVKRSMNWTNK